MKITFITTIDHNIGDDFVREGIKYLLRSSLKDEELIFENIHKHSPITVRHGFEFFKELKISKFTFPSQKLDILLPLKITKDRILEADLVIQSGAPVYWCHPDFGSHCSNNEWYEALIQRRFLKNNKSKLLNIAAGSCQEFYSDGQEFNNCTKDIEYIKDFYNLSTLTTVRDKLALNILNNINLYPELLPCPSIFAIDEFGLKAQKKKYLIINYMGMGGHYTFGKKIERAKWLDVLKEFYNYVKKNEEVLFVCHNKNEINGAKKIDNQANVFYSSDFLDYMKIYSQAKYGIMNRVHGAFLIASYGRPSYVIGNDSRAKMTEEIGLESGFINDISIDNLISKYEKLKMSSESYEKTFSEIKDITLEKYLDIFSKIFK